MTMLYLARHAEQERTPDEDPAAGLSALGRAQARVLGQRLRAVPLDGIHHSPLLRAQQTATIVAQSLPGVAVHASDLLRDRTPVPEVGGEGAYSAGELDWLAGVPAGERDPGGAGISAALEHFGSLGTDEQHLLITHAFVVGWFVRAALDAPARRWMGLNASNAGLSVIRCRPGHPDQALTLIGYNDIGHLPLR